nr:heavy-metal-associated domain-containing protein [Desulfobulbaceae bacterium]
MRRIIIHTFFLVIIGLTVVVGDGSAKAQGVQRTTLLVENLVCGSCLSLIEANLKKIPGVLGMSADFQAKTIIADHTLRISGADLAEALSSMGYPAALSSQEVVEGTQVAKFSNSFARCGVGGCSSGGCNATASEWKKLYRKFISKLDNK